MVRASLGTCNGWRSMWAMRTALGRLRPSCRVRPWPGAPSPGGARGRDIRAAGHEGKARIDTGSRVSKIEEFEEAHRRAGAAGDG